MFYVCIIQLRLRRQPEQASSDQAGVENFTREQKTKQPHNYEIVCKKC